MQGNVEWSDGEVYALVLFIMMYMDGKSWVTHKRFWSFRMKQEQYSDTSHCWTGKIYWLPLLTYCVWQVCLVDQEFLKCSLSSSHHLQLKSITLLCLLLILSLQPQLLQSNSQYLQQQQLLKSNLERQLLQCILIRVVTYNDAYFSPTQHHKDTRNLLHIPLNCYYNEYKYVIIFLYS